MKNIITILVAGSLVFVACRKERTCSCSTTGTMVSVSTPRDGSGAQSETGSMTGTNEQTVSKVKKDEMVRLMDCNSKTETSNNTYTTMVFTNTTYVVADVKDTYTTVYDCKIK